MERRTPVPTKNLTLSSWLEFLPFSSSFLQTNFVGFRHALYIYISQRTKLLSWEMSQQNLSTQGKNCFHGKFQFCPCHKQNVCSHCFDILKPTLQKSDCFLKVEVICAKKEDTCTLFFLSSFKNSATGIKEQNCLYIAACLAHLDIFYCQGTLLFLFHCKIQSHLTPPKPRPRFMTCLKKGKILIALSSYWFNR